MSKLVFRVVSNSIDLQDSSTVSSLCAYVCVNVDQNNNNEQ